MKRAAILCVDDDPIILDVLKMNLSNSFDENYLLEFAEGAAEALEVVDDLVMNGIEVVLLISDFIMPEMNGDEFVRIMKGKFPKLHILMLTGQITEDIAQGLLDEKIVNKVVKKPWDNKDLIELIKFNLKDF